MDHSIEKSHHSLDELRKLTKDHEDFPEHPKRIVMANHVDLIRAIWLFDQGLKASSDLTELMTILLSGLKEIKISLSNGGKRDEVMRLIEKTLKDSGFDG